LLQSGWLQAVETLPKHNEHSSYVLDTVPWQCMHIVVGTLVANVEVVSNHTDLSLPPPNLQASKVSDSVSLSPRGDPGPRDSRMADISAIPITLRPLRPLLRYKTWVLNWRARWHPSIRRPIGLLNSLRQECLQLHLRLNPVVAGCCSVEESSLPIQAPPLGPVRCEIKIFPRLAFQFPQVRIRPDPRRTQRHLPRRLQSQYFTNKSLH
jgi:hypothetical protein